MLRYLSRQPWVRADDITALGHSEGSAIVARMARHPRHLRRVIYLSGSPLGRILTQVSGTRMDADSATAETLFSRWQQVVAAPGQVDCHGDSNRLIFSLSTPQNPLEDLLHSRLPIFVGYGTRDRSALLNDYLRLEAIRRRRTNFSFHAYPEVEHNFFGFTNGQIDYEKGSGTGWPATFLRGCGRTSRRPPGRLLHQKTNWRRLPGVVTARGPRASFASGLARNNQRLAGLAQAGR